MWRHAPTGHCLDLERDDACLWRSTGPHANPCVGRVRRGCVARNCVKLRPWRQDTGGNRGQTGGDTLGAAPGAQRVHARHGRTLTGRAGVFGRGVCCIGLDPHHAAHAANLDPWRTACGRRHSACRSWSQYGQQQCHHHQPSGELALSARCLHPQILAAGGGREHRRICMQTVWLSATSRTATGPIFFALDPIACRPFRTQLVCQSNNPPPHNRWCSLIAKRSVMPAMWSATRRARSRW